MSCYTILQRRLRTLTQSFIKYVALAIILIILPKYSFLDLQQSKERDNRTKIRQLRQLFRILLNSKISFKVKDYKVKKILLKSFVSIAVSVNSITVMSFLALFLVDFKPSLQQLAKQFLQTMTRSKTFGQIRLLSLYKSIRNLYLGQKITNRSLVMIFLQETTSKSLKTLEKFFNLLRLI